MKTEIEIRVAPDLIHDEAAIKKSLARKLKLKVEDLPPFKLIRKSIDARSRQVVYQLRYKLGDIEAETPSITYLDVSAAKTKVHIIGAGPAGYFAALRCLELGLVPIVIERGKDVRARRRDLRAIQQEGIVDQDSNYCFGEGGAGTYSDGKLYTRSHKRGNIMDVLQILVDHGAKDDILTDAHPHIGSNKLPGIIASMRETIESQGGTIHFGSRVTDIKIKQGAVAELIAEDGSSWDCENLILATGHSGRDVYDLLASKSIRMEFKPFALGVRVEHPQALIDEIQYSHSPRHQNLPAASYKVVSQVDEKGVFSFCMCPGGLVVPASTAPGEIVVNGMSLSKRDSPFANSGVVTEVSDIELQQNGYDGIFAGIEFQKEVEGKMFSHGDGTQKAPAQRLIDFVEGRVSSSLDDTSYIPGLISAPLHELLPKFIYNRLRQGLRDFDKKLKGYYTQDANVIAVESRTSSPIRIPRDKETFVHPELNNFYPCGEGAGYAGGILSAALDGRNVVNAIYSKIKK